MSWTGFEPMDSDTPIGKLKKYANCGDWVGHYDPFKNGGSILCDQHTGNQRWVYLDDPTKYLSMSLAHAVRLVEFSICNYDIDYNWSHHRTPANWGTCATYIEFVPRFWGGLLGLIRMLPAIPAAHRGTFPCMVLRGVFEPTNGGGQSSYYGMNLRSDSDSLCPELFQGDLGCGTFNDRHMLLRAFIDLAHARGVKVGVSVIVNDGQIYLDGRPFSWANSFDREVYYAKLAFLVDLGIDCIHYDSACHMGDHYGQIWKPEHFNQHGGLPMSKDVMTGFNDGLMQRSMQKHNRPLSIAGEYCGDDWRFEEAHFRAGIDANAMSVDVSELCRYQWHRHWYKRGLFITNDNSPLFSPGQLEGPTDRALRNQLPGGRVPVWMTSEVLFPHEKRRYHDIVEYPIRWYHDGGQLHSNAAEARWNMNMSFKYGT